MLPNQALLMSSDPLSWIQALRPCVVYISNRNSMSLPSPFESLLHCNAESRQSQVQHYARQCSKWGKTRHVVLKAAVMLHFSPLSPGSSHRLGLGSGLSQLTAWLQLDESEPCKAKPKPGILSQAKPGQIHEGRQQSGEQGPLLGQGRLECCGQKSQWAAKTG
jgi:hypothetical protein